MNASLNAWFWFSPSLLAVTPSFFLLFAGLLLLLDKRENEDIDFSDLVSGNSGVLVRGAAVSVFIGLCGAIYVSKSAMNIAFFNSVLLLDALNILPLSLCLLMRRQTHLLPRAIGFSVLAIPMCLATLIVGGVLLIPLLFISCFKRRVAEIGIGTMDESAIPNPRGKKTYSPGEVADIEQKNQQRL